MSIALQLGLIKPTQTSVRIC